jgi:hypothetical protein
VIQSGRITELTRTHSTTTVLSAICLSAAVGISIPIALATLSGDYSRAIVLIAAIGIGALMTITFRWPFMPLLMYWGLYSFFSVFQLSTWRVLLAGVPVTVPDGVMLVMAVAVGIAWLRRGRANFVAAPSQLSIGMALLLGYGLLSAGLGAIHGFSGYAIGIDLRALTYLVIGFAAARLTLRAAGHESLLAVLFLVGLVGLVIEQTVVTLQEFARLPGLSVSIAALRDIGAPFYLGKYGIFLLLLMPLRNARDGAAMVVSTLAGLAALVATFIRTAWLEVAVGIVMVAMLGGWRAARRILVVLAFGLIVASVSLGLVPQVSVLAQAAQGRLDAFSQSSAYNVDTVALRLEESRTALANLRDPQDWIIGVGLGLSVADGLHPNQHNSFVWALSKQGVLGLLLFVGVIVVIPLVIGLRAVKSTVGLRRALLVTLLAAHIANIAGGFASGTITFSAYTPLLGMSLGWIADIAVRVRSERTGQPLLARRPGISMAMAAREP